jgi:hypothetical protein
MTVHPRDGDPTNIS